ncbi:MAG: CPBP family intramembrane metalloprotease [Caldilinea sp. CFX5]|nr:CPBP family intramembrane metalloprotease [Caldilinea sp. CFX5]
MTINFWLFALLTLALVAFIGYGTYTTARLLRHWRPDRNLLLLPAENLLRLVLIGVCIILGFLSGLPPSQLGWSLSPIGPQVLWGAVWGVVLALFFYGSTQMLVRATGQRFYSSVVIQAITPKDARELALVLVAMAPVVLLEELLFRSLLIGGFARVVPLPLLIVGWSVIFGLLHSPQGRWGMVGAGMGGLLLSLLFVTQGSLLLPLVAHYVTNMVQVIQSMRLRYAEARSTSDAADVSRS